MGLAHVELLLSNPVLPSFAPVPCRALADTGSACLCIPEHVAVQLQLQELEKREATFADGSRELMSYVGPVRVQFQNRNCFVGALVLGDEVLLGAIPMEDMDLVVRPLTNEVTVNPASPNFPTVRA